MNLLVQNSKMKKDKERVFNFGIPAFRSRDGFATCPMAGACVRGCYAKQGFYRMGNVQQAYEFRLAMSKLRSFPILMQFAIDQAKPDRVRIHDSGDFYSEEYLLKWIKIAAANPDVKFYAYSKMVLLIKSVTLPENFTVIFSYGGKQDLQINPKVDRHSVVYTTHAALKRSGYADASKTDRPALGKNHKIGLVYHGHKSTNWGV